MASQNSESTPAKPCAPKDKNCPFCGQAFTSSSLGRHLDLYIKEKNPKPSDGIHDVEAIKKLRGGITRRHPRNSIGARKGSTPMRTRRRSSKREASPQGNGSTVGEPVLRGGSCAVDSTLGKLPFLPRWEATGVINDIPAKGPWEIDACYEAAKRPNMQRNGSAQAVQKAQFGMKQRLADAMDTARAAELALRELLGSWRAAKQHVDNHSTPFDFDPLALDFPALTLQCLQPPPTLFSSTQHPTPTSWSVQSPGRREFGALQAFFKEEFRAWKVIRASATTADAEELTYPPSRNNQRDGHETINKAEKAAENLESSVEEHLQSAYAAWDYLPMQRQQELWILELARGSGRKQKAMENMKEQQHRLKQENANLKMQIDQLNRLQQPREFKLLSPTTIPIDRDVISYAYEQGVKGGKGVGFDMKDGHVDIATLVTKSIERWKNVVTSTRAASGGMSAQQPLDRPIPSSTSHDSASGSQSQDVSQGAQQQQQQQQQQHQPTVDQESNSTEKRPSIANSTTGPVSEHSVPSTSTAGSPSIEEEISDQDADAEMEDDGFAMMNASPNKQPHAPLHQSQSASLDVPRNRVLIQQQGSTPGMRFMMQSGAENPIGRPPMGMTRSMPNMNIAMQGSHMQGGDMTMMQQVGGNTLYMDNGM
ncbi:hypothetical protein EsDP_00002942 [Epichloe bromicola]|uniref:C2H2-type domain-containing protein n=1 Tax=Epichloe bromicola TaxID=79588 RepID=A0ABQ0CMB4_9HYPO